MDDLISRAKLFNLLAPVQTLAEAYAVIQGMKTETKKKPRGHWVVKRVYDQCRKRSIQCSECGIVWSGENWKWSFCPGCGAFNRKEV